MLSRATVNKKLRTKATTIHTSKLLLRMILTIAANPTASKTFFTEITRALNNLNFIFHLPTPTAGRRSYPRKGRKSAFPCGVINHFLITIVFMQFMQPDHHLRT